MDELRKGIAIGMLFGSGSEGHGNLITKTATENGVYTAAEEIDPETGEIFDPPKDGYSVFTVDLALDDKSVTLTTSQITGSQTAEFEYDPHDENPELEGYSLFTIDLGGVKDDIEDLQQQLSDLEDCRDAVIAKIQEYDPQFDPQDCQDIVDKIDEDEQAKEDAEQAEDELEQCRDAVIAKIQEYFPSFDPQTCQDLIDKIEEDEDDREDAEEHEGYTFPKKPDGTNPPIEEILELVGADTVSNNGISLQCYAVYSYKQGGIWVSETIGITEKCGGDTGMNGNAYWECKITTPVQHGTYRFWPPNGAMVNEYNGQQIKDITIDGTTGTITYNTYGWVSVWSEPNHGHWDTTPTTRTLTTSLLIGYGDGSYKVKNN